MNVREKLQDFKRRLSDRKMYSIVIALIGAVAVWGIYQYKHAANLRQELDNQYNRAFYEMVNYVDNVEVLLMKSLITNTPTKTAATLQEAWRQANLAQTNLGQLPVSQNVLANTSKFLTQVGDLSFSLNNQNMSGKPLNDDQYKTIEKLHGYAMSLEQGLNDLQTQITTGRIRWKDLVNKGTPLFKKVSSQMPKEQFENVDKTFTEYPTLIYDGPFSDHMTQTKPKMLTGNDITVEKGQEIATKMFGADRVAKVDNIGKVDKASIKSYTYNVTFKNAKDQSASVEVTQKGGYVLWMLYNRPINEEKIKMDEAKKMGLKFLEAHGYKGMVDTYYLKEDNTAIINYAYKQGDVVMYPDLIKVKVALDNGEVVGFESKGYISSHFKRDIPTPKLTLEQAKSKISARMNIESSGLAVIPTDFKTEIFTYEFKGKLDDKDFLVYINAETGEEVNILMIINTPNGTLTM